MKLPRLIQAQVALLVMLFAGVALADENTETRELLWPDRAPGAKGNADVDKPSLTFHPAPKQKATGTAVIVCPGGGYYVHAIDHEGLQVAYALNRMGVSAFVLSYRLRKNKYEPADALVDAKRAVRFVRSAARKYRIASNRIGVLGFSAGGHLTSAIGTDFDSGKPDATDPIEKESCRPDFLVLGYPVTSSELMKRKNSYVSTVKRVTEKTPPAFLWHTHEDGLTAEHSVAFYLALKNAGVSAELHVFGSGPHGLGLAPGHPTVGQWPALLSRWMRNSGLLTTQKRVAVSGRVTIEGKALHRGWVSLVPTGQGAHSKPIASAYITHKQDGKFSIDAKHGPVEGAHRIVIHEVAQQFLTVPSMGDSRVFDRASPDAKSQLTAQVKSDGDQIEIDITTK